MKKTILLGATALVAASFAAMPAFADGRTKPVSRDAEIQELKARIERLEAESADDKINTGSRIARLEKITDDVQWTFNELRPTLRTGDGRFEVTFRGRVQLDMASFEQKQSDFGAGYGTVGSCAATNVLCDLGSGAVFRRVRFGVEGKFFRDFIYELRFDFGGTDNEGAGIINIARVGYVGIPGLRIQVGALQPILTMYDSTSSAELTTMERPAVVTQLVGNFGGDNGRRGIEVTYQREGLLWEGDNFLISSAFTGDRVATNGTGHSNCSTTAPSTASCDDERSQVLGRMAYRLWSDGTSNIQIGASAAQILSLQGQAAGSVRALRIRERPEIRVTGERFIDTGDLSLDVDNPALAYGFEFGMNWENLYLAGEWYKYELDRFGASSATNVNPEYTGWYVEGEWILTGENKRYVASGTNNNIAVFRGPSIAAPWSLGGGTGAWSLHARYSDLDLNYNEGAAGVAATTNVNYRGGEQTSTNIGVTWYLNANLKVMGEYNMINIDRLRATDGASLNADFDVIQGRVQFTF